MAQIRLETAQMQGGAVGKTVGASGTLESVDEDDELAMVQLMLRAIEIESERCVSTHMPGNGG